MQRSDDDTQTASTIHDLAIERVHVLAQVFPNKQRYGAVGYGHRSSLVPVFSDEADKPGVLGENIYPPWAPTFNSRAQGYLELMFRPDNWAAYFASLGALRQSVVQALTDFKECVCKIARTSSPPSDPILHDPVGWDACRKSLRANLLLPKSAVDEWGFISDSSSENPKSNEKTYRSALERFTPVRKSINEYTKTVDNFMGQAFESMILIPYLRQAQGKVGKDALIKKATELGVNERSIHLSIINGLDSFKAIVAMQDEIGAVFPDGDFSGLDADFRVKELRAFDTALTTWCNFVNSYQQNERRRSNRRRKVRQTTTLRDFLNGPRNRLRSQLQSLKQFGITGRVISESVPWKGRPSLWLQYDVEHPAEILRAITKVWDCLLLAFDPDRENTIRSQVINCFWSEVILIPTVLAKSLDGIVMPHLNAVTFPAPPNFEASFWRFSSEKVDDGIFQQLGLQLWARPESDAIFERAIGATAEVFKVVEHLSDFERLDIGGDDLGQNQFQCYLDRTNTQLNQLLDDATKSLSDTTELISDNESAHPNLKASAEMLAEAVGYFTPSNECDDDAVVSLTIGQIVAWRDNLLRALECLGAARYFFLADTLSFPEWTPPEC